MYLLNGDESTRVEPQSHPTRIELTGPPLGGQYYAEPPKRNTKLRDWNDLRIVVSPFLRTMAWVAVCWPARRWATA